ncbi:MAG: alkaline phosphatase [Candidatus Hydrogenedentota bacterium]
MFLRMCAVSVLGLSVSFAGEAKSAILFIGDGMGLAQVTAGRIYQKNARDGKLALDEFEEIAIIRDYAANFMVTDSAAAGTALAAGHKTNNGMLGQLPDGTSVPSVLEMAKKAGKSVGVVTTTTITHATPAAFYAHVGSRAREDEIAAQLIESGNVDIALGGGREFFVPKSAKEPESDGKSGRQDERDLIAEARAAGYTVVQRQSEFEEVVKRSQAGENVGKILGLFNNGQMNYDVDRANDAWGEPSLAEMTTLAIDVLSNDPNGFFLMVEGGRIDHAGHANQAKRLVTDMLAFDAAVRVGVDKTNKDETLIVVTADHETGGLAINGYGNIEIGGEELLTATPAPSQGSILSFASGPGAKEESRAGAKPGDPGYTYPSLFYGSSAAHTGIDILAWASGPGSPKVKGTMLNSELGRLIIDALGVGGAQ